MKFKILYGLGGGFGGTDEDEPQEIVDARLSTIFSEIAELLELQGESLFKAN